jgi:hypothetical protein
MPIKEIEFMHMCTVGFIMFCLVVEELSEEWRGVADFVLDDALEFIGLVLIVAAKLAAEIQLLGVAVLELVETGLVRGSFENVVTVFEGITMRG